MSDNCKCIELYKQELIKIKNEWTKEAWSACNTDEERLIYYKCAERLHNFINEGKKE